MADARHTGEMMLGGAAAGAGLGTTAGLAGGPFAPITVPAGAGIGALLGAGLGGLGGLFGGHHKKPGAPWNPDDTISQYVNAYGATGTGADPNYIKNFIQQTDPNALKSQDSLRQYLSQYASHMGWQPGGAQAQTSASVVDPLATQLFFNQSIKPYMNEIRGDEKALAHQMTSQPDIPGLPASYNATLKAGRERMAGDMQMVGDATMESALNQPKVDQLIQMLGLVQQAKLKQIYTTQQGMAGMGGGTTPLPTK